MNDPMWSRMTSRCCVGTLLTFEGRLKDGRRLQRQDQLLGVLAERPALVRGHDELADEARPVPDVVVLVVLGQVQDVLSEQLGLRPEGRGNEREKERERQPQ